MIASFLFTLREGLEAALLIGIVLGTLRKLGREKLGYLVWLGVAGASAVSLGVALLFNAIGASFEGAAEEVFEGITMLLAAGVLTWVIFWMHRQARGLQRALESDVRDTVLGSSKQALFWLAFLVVVREGIELALFLTAVSLLTEGRAVLYGVLLGFGLVALLAWGLFKGLLQLNLGRFFLATSILLVLFAAGLVAHGVHELNEAGWIPEIISSVWDINHILDERSIGGEILKALFGYNGNPSLSEVLAYLGYFVVVGFALWRVRNLPAAGQPA